MLILSEPKSKIIAIACILLCLTFIVTSCKENSNDVPPPENEAIDFLQGESLVSTAYITDLMDAIDIHDVNIYDIHFEKNKKYRAFLFNDVLKHIYGKSDLADSWSGIAFTAVDGYKAVIPTSYFSLSDAYLVFQDMDFPEWQAIPNHGDDTVAPFYLIWTKEDEIPQNGFKWPWSIYSIGLMHVEAEYAIATPDEENVEESVMDGYHLYMKRCSSCHAISGEGGNLGPDLNKPQNILSYRSEEMVRSFIRESSSFRIGKMPDFKDLNGEQLDNLMDYLYYLLDEKSGSSQSG